MIEARQGNADYEDLVGILIVGVLGAKARISIDGVAPIAMIMHGSDPGRPLSEVVEFLAREKVSCSMIEKDGVSVLRLQWPQVKTILVKASTVLGNGDMGPITFEGLT